MNPLKKYILKVIESEFEKVEPHWEIIEFKEATWYTGTPDNVTSRCFYEIQFCEELNSYRLECNGDRPYSHSYYATMAKAVSILNKQKNDVDSAMEVVREILGE